MKQPSPVDINFSGLHLVDDIQPCEHGWRPAGDTESAQRL